MNHRPRKRFGQHFLHDPAVIRRIVAAIAPAVGDRLVEIGPGLGALTIPLLQTGVAVTAIELDRDAARELAESARDHGNLDLRQGDALEFSLQTLAPEVPLRLVGNLPYNVGTPLLFHLFAQKEWIRDMHFMLQKEVVQRLVAAPGSDSYGRLSVMAAWHCSTEWLFDVGPGAFSPPPKVWSAIVRLLPHRSPPVPLQDYATFEAIVRDAFGQRRKMLRRALSAWFIADEIAACDVDPELRAERLDLAAFARLANAAHAKAGQTG